MHFSVNFAKFGYLELINIIDYNEIYYTKFTTIQSSQVKKNGNICIGNKKEGIIVPIDAVEMYPSIEFSLLKKKFILKERLAQKPKIYHQIVLWS